MWRRSSTDPELAAIEIVHREQLHSFVRLANAITGDEQAAADAVHDGFVRAVRYRKQLRDRDSAPGWVCRIVLNEARRRHAAEGRHVSRTAEILDQDAATNGHRELGAAAAALASLPEAGSSVLNRALAATGDGEVLHLVYEGELPRALLDLDTGERTEVRAEHEVWFDPQAGLRETERFQGVVQFDVSLGAKEVSEHASSIYTSLGAGYREALESGQAVVVGEDVVDGTPVYWIRIETGHDVAVSRDSFEPVYVRVMQGETPALNRIVSYETVDAGSAPLEAPVSKNLPADLGTYGSEIELADARKLLGRDAVWAGASVDGLPLESVRELRLPAENGDLDGLSLMYGSPQDGPHIEITEAPMLADGLTMLVGVHGYAPPAGTTLLAGPTALLRSNGLVVAIHASDEQTAIAAARSLRPYSG